MNIAVDFFRTFYARIGIH